MNFMNGAHHVNIGSSSIINNVRNNVTINGNPLDLLAKARKLLDRARAIEASKASKTAAQATKCSPGTREQIIADIAGWVTDPHQTTIPTSRPILWFSGPAGGGKTTIMRNVVDKCEEAGLLAASYFFSSRSNLTREEPFVATISHQLADNPILERLILQAIQRRPSIFDESLELQLQRLVIEPLTSDEFRSSEPSARKAVIAVDGLDECDTKEQRKHLLGLLETLVETLPDSIRVILASRPEYDIRRAFSESLEPFTHPVELTQYPGAEDTRIYMCDEFQKIRKTHPMKEAIPENWPVQRIMDVLVYKSSGFFVLPSTLMKYLDNPRRNPVEALDEILAIETSSSSKAQPLAGLDALYQIILHPPDTDLVLMRRLLHILLELGSFTINYGDRLLRYSTSFLDNFCFLPPGSTDITLCDLHSILSIPSSDSSDSSNPRGITFHHKSMQDYLADPNRSLDMYQTRAQTLTDILLLSTRHLQNWEKNPGSSADTITVASILYFELIQRLLDAQDKPKLPKAILDFDPRIISEWWFVHALNNPSYIYTPQSPRIQFHKKMCKNRLFCWQLCRLISRVDHRGSIGFGEDMRTTEEGVEALPQFRVESGLYDPLSRPDVNWRWFLGPVKRYLPESCSSGTSVYSL